MLKLAPESAETEKKNVNLNSKAYYTTPIMAVISTEEELMLTDRLRQPSQCRQAFGQVVRLYSEPLYRQIRRMVPRHDDADDLLQNTFIKAWSSLENFRGEARLSTWLYKIAINEAISFLERERRRQSISIDDQQQQLINEGRRTHRRRQTGPTAASGCGPLARKAAARVQHEVLRRHEIRADFGNPRHQCRRP